LDSLARGLSHIDLVKIGTDAGAQDIVTGMVSIIERDRPAILLEFHPRRYSEPEAFLDILMSVYGAPRQITDDSELQPVSLESLLDERDPAHRLLFFDHHR
jgi:hypothetical protein